MGKALITGANRGLGLVMCQGLIAAGYEVVATVRPDSDCSALDGLKGVKKVFLEYEHPEMMDEILKDETDLDAVILNAGILYNGPFADMSETEINKLVRIDFWAVTVLARAAYAYFQKKGKGKIILVSSLSGHRPLPDLAVYGACKAGVAALGKALYLEGARDHIDVLTLLLGYYETGLWQEKPNLSLPPRDPAEINKKILRFLENRYHRWYATYGFLAKIQLYFSSVLYTPLARRVYKS